MAASYKTFQALPEATTLTPIYVAPIEADLGSVISTVVICNQDSKDATFRLSVAVQGASDTRAQYIAYDHPLRGNRSNTFTIGVALQAGDILRAYSSNGLVSFNTFVAELSS